MKIKLNSARLWLQILVFVFGLLIVWLLMSSFVYPQYNAKSVSSAINNSLKGSGRVVYINGQVHPNFFPYPGVSIQKINLTDKDGKTIIAKADELDIRFSWLSLFKGDYVIDSIKVKNSSLTVTRFTDGSLSLKDLFDNSNLEKSKYNINLNVLEIQNGFLAVIDMLGNNVGIIDSINLDMDNLLNQQAELKASARFYNGKQKIKFNLNTPIYIYKKQVQMDDLAFYAQADIGEFAKTRLLVNGKWTLNFQLLKAMGKNAAFTLENNLHKVNMKISMPNIYVGFDAIKAELVNVSGAFANNIDKYKFNGILENVIYQNKIFDSTSLNGHLFLNSDKSTLGFAISAPLHFANQKFQLAPMALSFNAITRTFQNNELEAKLVGKINGSLSDEVFLFYAYGKLNDSNVTIGIQQNGFFNAHRNADISLDNLDLNHYFPIGEKYSKDLFSSKAPIDLSWLNNADFNANLNIGNLFVGNLQFNNVMASVKASSGALQIDNIKAKIYGGSMDGDIRLENNKDNGASIVVNQVLIDVSIKPVLLGWFGFGGIDAVGNSVIKIRATGNSFNSFRNTLNGKVNLGLNNGYLSGIDIIRTFKDRQAKKTSASDINMSHSDNNTKFNKLSATIKIKDGVANNSDLKLSSQLLNVNGHGKVDLIKGLIDYTMDVKANSKTLDRQKNFNVPLKITGPIGAPVYALDFNEIVGGKKTKAEKQNAISRALKKQIDTMLP